MEENNYILSATKLCYYYQDGEIIRHILKDVTFNFERGKFYTILGESGSGKTTLLSILSALEEPKSGSIKYEGKDIRNIGLEKYGRNKIGIIFQNYNLINYMTSIQNVFVAMGITDNNIPGDMRIIAKNLLKFVGIDNVKARRQVNRLSGGEQQRVAIARSLATDVDLLFADEPNGNLNQEMSDEIVKIFEELAHKHNKCIIMVTHSKEIADKSDCILCLEKGLLKLDE